MHNSTVFFVLMFFFFVLRLVAGWPEHALPGKHDTRPDDTRHWRAGHEENWPGQKHSDGHEAQPGHYFHFFSSSRTTNCHYSLSELRHFVHMYILFDV